VGDQAYYLYNVTLEQKFWNDIGSIKLGRLTAGDDFATSPLYGYYLNNGIDGLIRSLVYNTQFTTYPCATWGARLQFEPNPDWTFKTGVYQVSDQIFNPNYHGVNFGINGSDGISVVQQACWAPEFNKAPAETSSDNDGARSRDTKDIGSAPKLVGMPGHYAIGGYWSNSNYSQFGTPVNTRISYGFYGQASQMIYREAPGSKEGLTVFGAIAYCPQQNISIIPLQLSGGVIYQGLLPDRPKDQTIFGVIHANFSSNYANSVSALGEGSPSNETDLEWGYRVQVTNFAYIQPDVQYIIQPGGTGNIPNAVVLGAQFGLTF
jgi:porin